jgi:hypothetical protein
MWHVLHRGVLLNLGVWRGSPGRDSGKVHGCGCGCGGVGVAVIVSMVVLVLVVAVAVPDAPTIIQLQVPLEQV